MKVYLNQDGPLGALAHHIVLEGDDVVGSADEADWQLSDPIRFPDAFVEGLFPSESSTDLTSSPSWFISRVFDGSSFLNQTLVGVPLKGLMNGGQSADEIVGCVCGYVEVLETLRTQIETSELTSVLANSGMKGFVSFTFTDELKVSTIQMGMPSYGLYAAFEGLDQKITDWHRSPKPFRESWTCALLCSRYPWPMWEQDEKISFKLTPEMERHVHLFPHVNRFKDTCITHGTRIGIASSWSPFLGQACGRAIGTLEHLDIPKVQFRTDAKRVALGVVGDLVKRQLVSCSSSLD